MLCNTLNILLSIIIAISNLKKEHDEIRTRQRLGGDSTNRKTTKLFSEAQNCSIEKHVMFKFFAQFDMVRCSNTIQFFNLLKINSKIWDLVRNPVIKKIRKSKIDESDNLNLLVLLARYLLIFLNKELVVAIKEENIVMRAKIKEYIESLIPIDGVLTDMMNKHPNPVNLKKKRSPLKTCN